MYEEWYNSNKASSTRKGVKNHILSIFGQFFFLRQAAAMATEIEIAEESGQ